jgi:hypothetical protein
MTDVDATQHRTTTPAPARIVTDKVTEKLVPLEYPVEFDGKTWTEVRVHRVTGMAMAVFLEKIRSGADEVMPPMVDCPLEVWNGMDADDQFAVDQAAGEFMPRRLKDLQKAAVAFDAGK